MTFFKIYFQDRRKGIILCCYHLFLSIISWKLNHLHVITEIFFNEGAISHFQNNYIICKLLNIINNYFFSSHVNSN